MVVSPALHRGPQETVFVSWGGSVGTGSEKGREPRRGGAKGRAKRSNAVHAIALGLRDSGLGNRGQVEFEKAGLQAYE